MHVFLLQDEIFQFAGRTLQSRSKDVQTKRPLSITLNKQSRLYESSSQLKKSNSALKRRNEVFTGKSEKADVPCNDTKDIDSGSSGYLDKRESKRRDVSNKSNERRPSETNVDIQEAARSGVDEIDTRLNLDVIDSDSETSTFLKDDLKDAKREKDELVSRKPTVKSARPTTKPALLRKFAIPST